MPDPDDAYSTLDDFLLSLAEGVSQAQTELSRGGVSGPQGAQFSYHLPRVEFELKMNLQVVQDAKLTNRYAKMKNPLRSNNKHLLFAPVAAESSSSTLEIAAVVKGAFVAVPANNGLPAIQLTILVDSSNALAPVVQVVAQNAAGEPMSDLMVEFNVDREESDVLTQADGKILKLNEGTRFQVGAVSTGENGVADGVLNIPAAQGAAVLALVIDAAGQTETIIYEVR